MTSNAATQAGAQSREAVTRKFLDSLSELIQDGLNSLTGGKRQLVAEALASGSTTPIAVIVTMPSPVISVALHDRESGEKISDLFRIAFDEPHDLH